MNKITAILTAAVAAVSISCQKENKVQDTREAAAEMLTVEFTAGTPTKTQFAGKTGTAYPTLWQTGDKVGISAEMAAPVSVDITPSEDFATATFTAELPVGSATYYGLSPFAAFDGTAPDAANKTLQVKVPAEQTALANSCDPAAQILYSSVSVAEGQTKVSVQFHHATAYGKLTLTNLDLGTAVVQSVSIAASADIAGLSTLNFTDGSLVAKTGVKSISVATAGVSDIWFACLPSDLSDGSLTIAVYTDKGVFTKVFNLSGKELKFEAGKVSKFSLNMSGSKPVKLEWATRLPSNHKFAGNTPAVDNLGNVYCTLYGASPHSLYKINSDGTNAWSKTIGGGGTMRSLPAVEPDGSVIYAMGGDRTGVVVAFNNDGTVKWSSSTTNPFWSKIATTEARMYGSHPAIGTDNIYVGYEGSTQSLVSINKNTGARVAYVVKDENGTEQPGQGLSGGLSISKSGTLSAVAGYGLFTVSKAELDNPTKSHATYGGYVTIGKVYTLGGGKRYNGVTAAAPMTKDGEHFFAYLMYDPSKNVHIYRIAADGGSHSPYLETSTEYIVDYVKNNANAHTVQGTIIGNHNETIVTYKHGTATGGILAINFDGTVAYEFKTPGLASASPVIDNNGYIHIITDDYSVYYIVKPDFATKNCDVVARVDLFELLKKYNAPIIGTSHKVTGNATPITMGIDGKVYLPVNFSSGQPAAVICVSYAETTSPSAVSPWPMRGGDGAHTGMEK